MKDDEAFCTAGNILLHACVPGEGCVELYYFRTVGELWLRARTQLVLSVMHAYNEKGPREEIGDSQDSLRERLQV